MKTAKKFWMADINRILYLLLTDVFNSTKFCATGFNAKSLNFSAFLRWVYMFKVPLAVKII